MFYPDLDNELNSVIAVYVFISNLHITVHPVKKCLHIACVINS